MSFSVIIAYLSKTLRVLHPPILHDDVFCYARPPEIARSSIGERFCKRWSISRIPTLFQRLVSILRVLQGREAKRFYWIRVRAHTG
jgi:hypothetical protein